MGDLDWTGLRLVFMFQAHGKLPALKRPFPKKKPLQGFGSARLPS